MRKLLLISFEHNEDEILNQILTFLNTGNRVYNLLDYTIEQELIFDGIIVDIAHRLIFKNGMR